jgi:iron(III) transport system permease protein
MTNYKTSISLFATKYISKIVLIIFVVIISAPVMNLILQSFGAKQDTWHHLWQYKMKEYITTSLILVSSCVVICSLIGVYSAWFMSQYKFKYHALCHWLLIVPIAIPSYILAYAYTDLLQFSGVFQTTIRAFFPDFRLPDVRSLPVAVMIFSINLYPYVYLICYSAFSLCNKHVFEVGQMLGEKHIFYKIALPLIRPSLIASLSLVSMEILADYGTVSYFGLQTFSLGIYRSWLSFDDKANAMLLAVILLAVIAILLFIEYKARQKQKFYTSRLNKVADKQSISYKKSYKIWLIAITMFSLALILPICSMLNLFLKDMIIDYNWQQYLQWLKNTLIVAGIASFFTVFISFAMNVLFKNNKILNMGAFGYAIPGTILAISILGIISFISHNIIDINNYLSASIWLLIYAYFIRFFAIAHKGISTNYQQLSPNLGDVAQLLGCSKWQVVWRVYFPLLKQSLFSSFLLVGIDSVKELPCTMLLRPFNFDTLAVISNQLASDERIAELSLPALTMIILSLIPMFGLYNKSTNINNA